MTLEQRISRLEQQIQPRQYDTETWERYKADKPAFAREQLGIELDATQQEALQSPALDKLLRWGRQVGKSTTMGLDAYHGAVFETPLTLIVSGGQEQANLVQREVTGYAQTLGQQSQWIDMGERYAAWIPKDPRSDPTNIVRCSSRYLELGNGHRVVSVPASATTVRGWSPHKILIDEAAYVPDSVFAAVTPMRSVTRAPLICGSSAGAQLGWYYEWWMRDDPECYKSTYLSRDCPRVSQHHLEREKQWMPDAIYQREYECVFMPAEGRLFSPEMVQDMFSPAVQTIRWEDRGRDEHTVETVVWGSRR